MEKLVFSVFVIFLLCQCNRVTRNTYEIILLKETNIEELRLIEEEWKLLDERVKNLRNLKRIMVYKKPLFNTSFSLPPAKSVNGKLVLDSDYRLTLPEEICDLEKLELLLVNNPFITKFPKNFGRLQNLKKIDVFFFPEENVIDEFQKLKELPELKEINVLFGRRNPLLIEQLYQLFQETEIVLSIQ